MHPACFARRAPLLLALAASLALASRPARPAPAAEPIDFDRAIRPILSDNCFSCHGPDGEQRQADLRLDRREDAVRSGAIDEQNFSDSAILARINSSDPEQVMPPPESNKRLSAAQKQLLAQWMEQGAKYTQHWSFVPPRRAELDDDEKSHAIDALVDRLIEREGLTASPPADPATLARRLSLDLIGLPPSQRQVQKLTSQFSPQTVNELVEELLASPHYGERMAIAWLDVVRFADTIGYHSDTPRNVYPYRDYVINSFNRNKPFDQFTIEQVAGDLLPDATQEQKVASCFNRLLLTTEEGGAQAKDYEARYLGDRVRAIGTAWLGLTIGCSQCHDHKFDPITSRDFYSLGAFFADIDEAIIGKREPGMLVPTPEQAHRLQMLKATVDQLKGELALEHPQLAEERQAWEARQLALASAENAWLAVAPSELSASAGSTIAVTEDKSVLLSGKRPNKEVYRLSFKVPSDFGQLHALRLEALPHDSLPAKGSGRAGNGNFVLTEIVATLERSSSDSSNTSNTSSSKDSAATSQREPIRFAAARASIEQQQAAEKHPDKRWSAASTIDNDVAGSEWGWAILPDVTKPQQLQLKLAEPLELHAGDVLHIDMRNNHGNKGHSLGHFRWSLTSDALAYEAPLAESGSRELLSLLQTPAGERTPAQAAKLLAAFNSAAPSLEGLRKKLAETEKELASFEASLPRCLVSTSLAKPRLVRILPRGNWQDDSGPIVSPQLPAFLATHDVLQQRPLTRLDLARWLVDRDNPLTARVFVNRLWKQFFGVGLSKSLDDLGAQGEAPVNGPLLDYLAVEFMESGWDVKHIVRLIVSSRAYQRSSDAPAEMFERDPENRYVARQSRYRLPAELVRDNALAISGLLSLEVGGPSVKPYQPEDYWENLNFPPRKYVADPPPLQHRRGLYVWWQRSFVHPSMLAFDAPTREECAADRAQSNIPQQALVLLNDPTYVEAARALGTNFIAAGDAPLETRIAAAFRRATAREPSSAELDLLVQLHTQSQQAFAADRQATEAFLGNTSASGGAGEDPASAASGPDRAAAIQVARAILNLHEVITRY
jgi:mono/diheme cytochrome c family protein